jgi:hypothetical protein
MPNAVGRLVKFSAVYVVFQATFLGDGRLRAEIHAALQCNAAPRR